MNKKILCTLGPSSMNSDTIQRLDSLKIDLFRLNLSHTPVDQIEPLVDLIRANSSVPICLDTQGAQARTGNLQGGTMELAPGSVVELVVGQPSGKNGSFLPIHPASLLDQIEINDMISVDFGSAMLQVTDTGPKCLAQVLYGGSVGSNKALSIVGTSPDLPPLTESDYRAIEVAKKLDVDSIALSFANQKEDVEHLRSLAGPQVRIIAKIESWDGLENLDGILEVTDSILIDRGDLSREIALESIPFAQKDIIGRANAAGVPVYVATNLLESMVTSPRPTRAEVNDVVNTLIDGADGLVLAAETAIGEYPIQCVKMIKALIQQFEARRATPKLGASPPSSGLITPHGGRLMEHIRYDYDMADLKELPALEVDEYDITDVYQLAVGAYSPLSGFMDREELEGVLENNRLPDGSVWTMPIMLQLPETNITGFTPGETIALTYQGEIQALLQASECFSFNLEELATRWFGTAAPGHPGVARLLAGTGKFLAGKGLWVSTPETPVIVGTNSFS
jgi:pyruvate kinase